MKDKLCVILRSEYPTSGSLEYRLWNVEVNQDSETVHATLTDHDIVEIIIPVRTKRASIAAHIKDIFDAMSHEHVYASCHIVLNTHSRPGHSDLTDDAMKQVLQIVSRKNIAMTQISALQCHGMSALSSARRRTEDPMMPTHASSPRKESSMGILQQKLEHLITDRAQTFRIYGFIEAYNPFQDKDKVVDVLLGNAPTYLSVTTSIPKPLQCYLEQIRQSIDIIKKEKIRAKDAEYDAAGSLLAIVLDSMKQNIMDALKDPACLQPENRLFLEKLRQYAREKLEPYSKNESERSLNIHNFNGLYRQWIKTHKIHSEERLEVLEYYYRHFITSHIQESLVKKFEPDHNAAVAIAAVTSGAPQSVEGFVAKKVVAIDTIRAEAQEGNIVAPVLSVIPV